MIMIREVIELYQSAMCGGCSDQQTVVTDAVLAHAQDVLLALGKEKDRLAVAGQSSELVDTLYNSVLWLVGFGSVGCEEVRP